MARAWAAAGIGAAVLVALMVLPSCEGFAVVPAGRLVPALGARVRPLRRLVVAAALSDDKDVKPADAYAAASPSLRVQSDEAVMESVTEAGRQELKSLADLTKQEQEELKKKLEEVCSRTRAGKRARSSQDPDAPHPPRRTCCFCCPAVRARV